MAKAAPFSRALPVAEPSVVPAAAPHLASSLAADAPWDPTLLKAGSPTAPIATPSPMAL